MSVTGDKTVQARGAALLLTGGLALLQVGPELVEGEAVTRSTSRRPELRWTVRWTPAGWTCTCTPRRPGPCSHITALRGVLAAVAPEHISSACDPWTTADGAPAWD